ncbi:cytochrome c oxidase subunit 7A2, mitochondrial-like [Stegastes partitus]|uniref:Cytochrome c oxidase subunit 7A2, mitochondrial n=1 Tax=Stegastes partitus TaxID=144197 RepID=A0A3B5AY86_9TELE|nr:PREDICTED: cytochrome c oxidase subunit 7A2, mitochondrial-like [Stegastes partitus]
MFRQLMSLQQLSRRTITSSARRQINNSVKEKQKHFQDDNGLPIHLKGGSSDAVLFGCTMMLTVVGVGYVLYELFSAAMPKKPQ